MRATARSRRGLSTSIWSIARRGRRHPGARAGSTARSCPCASAARHAPPRRRRHVAVEGRVVGEHHAIRVAELEQGDQRLDAPLVGENVLHPESVHADRRAVVHERPQVVEVLAVARVADDDPVGRHAALAEERLLLEPVARRRVGMGRDRHAGLLVGHRGCRHDPRDVRGDAVASVMTLSMPARTRVPAIPSGCRGRTAR